MVSTAIATTAVAISEQQQQQQQQEEEEEEEKLSSLPTHLLEAVIHRLCLEDVWRLWQTSSAMQTAVRQCEWVELAGPRWLLAVRMFAPGRVRRVSYSSDFSFEESKFYSENCLPSARWGHLVGVWECLVAHAHHFESVKTMSELPLTFLTPPSGWPSPPPPPPPPPPPRRSRPRPHLRHRRPALTLANSPLSPTNSAKTIPSPKRSRTLTLAHFTLLRELHFGPPNVKESPPVQLAALSQLTTLTSIGLNYSAKGVEATVEVLLQLPHLRKLVLMCRDYRGREEFDLTLSEGALAAATQLECMELYNCTWSGSVPSWLGKLSALQALSLKAEMLDMSTLAGLPALSSLKASVGALTNSSHFSSFVERPAFPCLKLLDVNVWSDSASSTGATLDFDMLSSLKVLNLSCNVRLVPVGTMASMSKLTSLELFIPSATNEHGENGDPFQHGAIEPSAFAGLPNLNSIVMNLGAAGRPLDLSGLAHVRSVELMICFKEGDMLEADASSLGRLTGTEVLGYDSSDPLSVTSHLSGLSRLTSLIATTPLRKRWEVERRGLQGQQRRHRSVRIVLPQVRRMKLKFPREIDEAWGFILPNVVHLEISDCYVQDLPAMPEGAWPRLMFMKVNVLSDAHTGTSMSHTWFTLPSLRRMVLSGLKRLPDIPAIPRGKRAPLRELELAGCESWIVPQTITNLRELTSITIKTFRQFEMPGDLDGRRIKVVQWRESLPVYW